MQSLFSEAGKQEMMDRLQRLPANASAQWGKMNVAQMLAHCQVPIEVALGTHPLKNNLKMKIMSALFGKMVKKKLMSGGDTPKNSPTAPSFIVADERHFETEKKKLADKIEELVSRGKARQLSDIHPFFGKMSIEDWDVLHYKHLDHHLKQFGG